MRHNLNKLERKLAEALFRRMPVENCHSGRGWGHSEKCFHTCYSSWEGDVNEIALTLSHNRKQFARELFVKMATHVVSPFHEVSADSHVSPR